MTLKGREKTEVQGLEDVTGVRRESERDDVVRRQYFQNSLNDMGCKIVHH